MHIEILLVILIMVKIILLKDMIILQEKQIKQKTCIDYSLSLLGREVGLLLVRSYILGNEVY